MSKASASAMGSSSRQFPLYRGGKICQTTIFLLLFCLATAGCGGDKEALRAEEQRNEAMAAQQLGHARKRLDRDADPLAPRAQQQPDRAEAGRGVGRVCGPDLRSLAMCFRVYDVDDDGDAAEAVREVDRGFTASGCNRP